jgi:hypothetical protein
MSEELPQQGYGLRSFIRHEVYEVVVIEGEGVTGDPVRAVTYWMLPEGKVLLRRDPVRLLAERDDQ